MCINESNYEMFEKLFRSMIGYDDIYAWADDKLEDNKKVIAYVLGDNVKGNEFKWLGLAFERIMMYLISNENEDAIFIEYLEDLGRLYYLHVVR